MFERMTVKEAVEVMAELVDLHGWVRYRWALIVLQKAAEKNERPEVAEPIKALFRSVGVEVEEEK
jgi:hypothetical protein